MRQDGSEEEAGRELSREVFSFDHPSIVVYACFTNFGEQ